MKIKLFAILLLMTSVVFAAKPKIKVGAENTDEYLPWLNGKSVGIVANQTSIFPAQKTHLVDSLLQLGINVKKIFTPEHGFRGIADAGEEVESSEDSLTGLPLISLYGNHKKPTPEDLSGVSIVVFDLQDVGVRFYTYISTMHYVMEACAQKNIPVIVLDRPNPNGFFIDGPVLDTVHCRSFVGMHPVPIVYGMTIGEYAQMINSEGWLAGGVKCNLRVVRCQNYNHDCRYSLPVPPSPNLPNNLSVMLYPTLGLFEGTVISVGRGTNKPFQQIGNPKIRGMQCRFTPHSMPGAKNPPHENRECQGLDFTRNDYEGGSIALWAIRQMINSYPDEDFFTPYFIQLSGTTELQKHLKKRIAEPLIRQSWQPGIEKFKDIRAKYLLYDDFTVPEEY